MPCYEPTRSDELWAENARLTAMRGNVREIEAMLCAILSVLSFEDIRDICAAADWAEAGVTRRQFWNWWNHHCFLDRHRREMEVASSQQRPAADSQVEP